jgi:hypothetical protein
MPGLRSYIVSKDPLLPVACVCGDNTTPALEVSRLKKKTQTKTTEIAKGDTEKDLKSADYSDYADFSKTIKAVRIAISKGK